MSQLESRWVEMLPPPEKPAFQRIDPTHPLDFYIGRDPSGEWLLLLVSDDRPPQAGKCTSIAITSRRRDDGRWALLFRLENPELQKLFAIMCDDIVEATRSSHDRSTAAATVMGRFVRWQRLLEKMRSHMLDDRHLRGLIGELVFLEHLMDLGTGMTEAVASWVGSEGADRDFSFPDREFEIKSVPPGNPHALISSAEQLDLAGKDLFLTIVGLDRVKPTSSPGSFTPLDIVSRLRNRLEGNPAALDSFNLKLLETGFLFLDEYGSMFFTSHGMRHFVVREGFPLIVRSRLPEGIGSVKWEIELKAIQSFETDPFGGVR